MAELSYRYRPEVLVELSRHGVAPRPETPPGLIRDFVRELYKYEIRVLRDRLIRGEFPKTEYASRVDDLRRRYPVLGLLPDQFIESHQG